MANAFEMNGLKFKQTRKKEYTVYVCMPQKGTSVTNKLEGSQYVTDETRPFVISGTVGEQWVIDAGKLAKTYCFIDGQEITPDALKARVQKGLIPWMHLRTKSFGNGEVNFAAHLPLSTRNFPVQTSWGDTLLANRDGVPHGQGDFLVCASVNGQPNLNDVWVVNGEVFATTYDMRAFPGLGGSKAKETPVPKPIVNIGGAVGEEERKQQEKVKYIVNSLRQKGNTIGKVVDKGNCNYKFTVNNGKYGVTLFINEGDPVEGSSSITVMYHSDNSWKEAATWFIDDFGLDDSINKLHELINGDSSLDGLVGRVNTTLHAVDDIDKFSNYSSDMQQPAYVKQLIKTYNYVKDRLKLYSSASLLTETTEEPIHWRIDFSSHLCPDAAIFMDIDPDTLTACIQTDNGDGHWEDYFGTNVDGCKQAFSWVASMLKELGN